MQIILSRHRKEAIDITKEQMQKRGYYDLFADLYNMLKSYPADELADDPFWEQKVAEAAHITDKYSTTAAATLSRDLAMSILGEMERSEKEKRAARCDDLTAPTQTT